MKRKYSYFDKLCALNYNYLMATAPLAARAKDIKRCTATLNNR